MATIINYSTKEEIYLHYLHTFGRGKANNTQIKVKDISTDHAKVYWQEKQWFITDRSRNGTVINNQFISNTTQVLNRGDIIRFGRTPATQWQVLDLAPPSSYLHSLHTGKNLVLAKTYYALPNEQTPAIELLRTHQGWALEKEDDTFFLTDKQAFDCQGERWVFVENELIEDTVDHSEIKKKAAFVFTLSADQEKVNVKILVGETVMDLGTRTYNQVLLILAQQRKQDTEANCTPKDQGWMSVENLVNRLSKEELKEIDQYNLNTRIRRIRKDLLALPPYGNQFVNIIERKRGAVRFNHSQIRIHY